MLSVGTFNILTTHSEHSTSLKKERETTEKTEKD